MSAAGAADCVLVFHARASLGGAAGDELAAALQRECATLQLRGRACVADDGAGGALRGSSAALHRLRGVVAALPQLQSGARGAVAFQVHAWEAAPSGAAADAARATSFSLHRARELATLDAACAWAALVPRGAPPASDAAGSHGAAAASVVAAAAAVPRAPGGRPRLRLLCLHGFRQSGASLAGRLASLRARLAADAEFIFLDAPHPLPPPASLRGADGSAPQRPPPRPRRAWLVSASDAAWGAACAAAAAAGEPPPPPPPLPAPMGGGGAGEHPFAAQSAGWDASLAALVAALRRHSPVDGMLGLSQGAAVAAAAAAALQGGAGEGVAPLRLLWLAGGFVPPAPAGDALRPDAPLRLRSLHVFGGDAHVGAAASEALAACFAQPTLRRHAAGHLLPSAAADGEMYAAFLRGAAA